MVAILEFSDVKLTQFICSCADKTAVKRIILLPHVKECCGKAIVIRNRPSFPLVYTTNGTFVGALFTGECRGGCSSKFSHSFYECNGKNHYVDPKSSDFFHITSQTVFSTKLLEDFTNNISISAASFQSRAEVYNENFRVSDMERLKYCSDFGRSLLVHGN